MTTLRQTRFQTAQAPRFSPLGWLLALDAAFRERAAMKALDADQRKDMGLTQIDTENAQIFDILRRDSPRI